MAKAKAVSKRKKQPNRLVRFFRETRTELGKVTWPTREDAIRLTTIVLVVLVISSILLGGLDFLFTRLFLRLFGIG